MTPSAEADWSDRCALTTRARDGCSGGRSILRPRSEGAIRATAARPVHRGEPVALALIAGVAGVLVKVLVDDRRASLHAAQGARMEAMARGRAEVLATWVNGLAQTGRRLTEADLLRLFASELARHEPAGTARPRWSSTAVSAADDRRLRPAERAGRRRSARSGRARAPVKQQRAAGLQPGRSCSTIGASAASPRCAPATATMPCSARGCSWISPCLCRSPSPGWRERPEIAAVLFMTVPVAEQLASLLDPGPVLGVGERLRLIQWGEQGSEQVIPGPDPRVVAFTLGEPLAPGQSRPYGPLTKADGSELFAVGAAVPGLPWAVLHEIDATVALAPLREFAIAALALAGLAGLALALAFAAFWWRRRSAHQRELAAQYRHLAAGIQRQRRLLESITNAMQEMLCLKTAEGRTPTSIRRSAACAIRGEHPGH
jgi:hypothetical protein